VIDAIKTVLSGAIGIRRRSDAENARLKPVHVIIAAIVLVALFILTLVTVVRIVTS
jgi:hypothetical protein